MIGSKEQTGGSHYKDLAIQLIDFIVKNKIPFCEANIIKYVTRHRSKNKEQDILKAAQYLCFLVKDEYPEVAERILQTVAATLDIELTKDETQEPVTYGCINCRFLDKYAHEGKGICANKFSTFHGQKILDIIGFNCPHFVMNDESVSVLNIH